MKEIAAVDLSYTYQGKYQQVQALSHVSCTFEAGKFYAIVGRSGSGKTTLLSLLAGLGKPSGGAILVDGRPLDEISGEQHRREHVSVIYQAFHLFPVLTVLENVMYPMEMVGKPKKEARQKARQLLQSVGITSEKHRKFPTMLSGGEQQRVAIARALASDAKMILADEPTGNLDMENGALVIDILKNLVREQGYCVAVITHDMEIAAQADVIYRMVDGRIQQVE